MTIKEFEKKHGIHFTLNHSGKMSGMASLSTSVTCNKNCAKHASVPNSICSHCYANRMMKRYKTLENVLAKNTSVLTSEIIPVNEWPLLNMNVFRFESFGDINNATQVINYFNLCERNPETRFALWTKNAWIVKRAIASGHKKPSNLIIIASSILVNKPITKAVLDNSPFIDKVFTVYDKETAKTININCGARNCYECQRCYRKTDTIEYVNEILK